MTRPLIGNLFLAACLAGLALRASAAGVDIDAYIKKDTFEQVEISPTGEYLAATVPLEDRTGLVVLRRADKQVTARVALGKDTHISDFTWVTDTRLVLSIAEAFGTEDQPTSTGELFAVDADGKNMDMLVGYRAVSNTPGSRLQGRSADAVFAQLIDRMPENENEVLISVSPFVVDPYTRVELMDIRNGRRKPVTRAPVSRAGFLTDNAHAVRFAQGIGKENFNMLYHRKDDDSEWELVNDESKTGHIETPMGFAADNRIAYLRAENAKGPDSVIAFDTQTGERKPVFRHDLVDPRAGIRKLGDSMELVGVSFSADKDEFRFFDPNSAEARLYGMLQRSFGGDTAYITSTTRDGNLALVQVYSGTNPGDFYLFDVSAKKADYLLSRADWFDPAAMGQVRPVSLKTRDGLDLHGFLTLPPGSDGKNLPMVVNPHGGPFGLFDEYGFDSETQMLAKAGYAVLKVNFRGSGNYGRQFQQIGAQQWGGTMQDDLTDATRWAVSQGIADARRICIYGGSYGAYAALMGVAKEPDLYRCAVGYVGVYGLDAMVREASGESASSSLWHRQWIGERGTLDARSPNKLADRIKVPVFLAAGGEDETAPIAHTRSMASALRTANVPVETLYFANEGHGFYEEAHRREFYQKLLAFLDQHIGAGAK